MPSDVQPLWDNRVDSPFRQSRTDWGLTGCWARRRVRVRFARTQGGVRMPRARLRIALAASFMLLVVAGSGSAIAGPFTSGPLVQVSGASPIAACDGDDGNIGGTNFLNSEVEPYVMVDPSNPAVLSGAWQQDRWSNG